MGFRYLGGIEVVLTKLAKRYLSSLIDIGFGDGQILREVKQRHPSADLLGVDYSERNIRLSRAFNPEIQYEVANIITDPPDGRFEVATLLEVLEHILPSNVPGFLDAVSSMIVDDGVPIFTVQHRNL